MATPGLKLSTDPLDIVLIGDSLACGTGDEADSGLAGRLRDALERRGSLGRTTNLGVNGATTAALASRLRQPRIRNAVANADVILLSIGANDLFRSGRSREETLRDPMRVAKQILQRIAAVVSDLRGINGDARILLLGGYNPVPWFPLASLVDEYLVEWDSLLAARFADDPRVSVVTIRDLVKADTLSRYDNFHPGAAAYERTAERVADLLVSE